MCCALLCAGWEGEDDQFNQFGGVVFKMETQLGGPWKAVKKTTIRNQFNQHFRVALEDLFRCLTPT